MELAQASEQSRRSIQCFDGTYWINDASHFEYGRCGHPLPSGKAVSMKQGCRPVSPWTVESDETFFVNLSAATSATIGEDQAVGTIQNDDSARLPSLVIGDASASEGNSGTNTFSFPVTLSASSAQTVTVNFATANGTATAGSDYVAASGTVSFNPGQTSGTVSVTVNGDSTREPNESFVVNLSGAVNATIDD